MKKINFKSTGIQIIRNALTKQTTEILAKQFDIHKNIETTFNDAQKTKNHGDLQVPLSFSAYGTITFDSLLLVLQKTIEEILQEDLLPTYSYARIYYNNATLEKHLDRPSCEYSATACIEKDQFDWPIFIEDYDGNVHCVELNPGDLLLYHGTELQHWREQYQGQKQIQAFLHYVSKNGNFADHFLDNRDMLGINIKNKSDSRNELKDYILELPNLIPDEKCNEIIRWSENQQWKNSFVDDGSIEKNIRNCQYVSLNESPFDSELFAYVSKAIQKYAQVYKNISISKDTGYELLKYEKDGFYKEHVDSYAANPRIITLSLTINDNFEGGEWSFFGGKHKMSPKKGSAILFPSNFMYTHAILPITNGTRYSIITWFI